MNCSKQLRKKAISMDETLSYRESESMNVPTAGANALPRHTFRFPRLKGLHTGDRLSDRSGLSALIFMIAGLSLTFSTVLGGMYVPGYELTVDGEPMGRVDSVDTIHQAVANVEHRASQILGHDYTMDRAVGYSFALTAKDELVSMAQIEAGLFDQVGEVMKTSVLTINGEIVGAAESETEMKAMLNEVKAPYVNDNTISAEFVEPVRVSRQYTAANDIRDEDEMLALLTSNSLEEVDYVVQAGDTFSGIANGHDMKMSELKALNPAVEINTLMIGDVLTISQAVPMLSVRTVDHVVYDGTVPYEVEEVQDSSMYEGDSVVLTSGVEGLASYTADVTYLNGTEESREILDTQMITEPVTQVVAVGTKERPRTMATGHFQWPLWGTITSGYGSRYIFGSYSFHSGIDIAAPYGTPIAAADGGRVTWAGYGSGSYWSYGNYVVIDHENGLQTIYGHCSSVDVVPGERVYKGQTVGRVGSTGRSTGSHLHFQVKQNGVTVSPYTYLP